MPLRLPLEKTRPTSPEARLRKQIAATTLSLAAIVAGCQSTQVAPFTTATAAATTTEPDEARLWARSVEEQAVLDGSGFRAELPAFEAYLDTVIMRLAPPTLPGTPRYRTRIIVDPTLNAFAFPNGVIYIHTGLLARLENESQLATILSHEITHATNRHGLKNFRNAKNASAFVAGITVGTAGIGSIIGLIGASASVSGYSQDLEREADVEGFARLVAAGYDPAQSIRAFEILTAEARRSKIKEPFFFGSHPRLTERIDSFRALVAGVPPAKRQGGAILADAYDAQLPPVLILNAEAALRAGDFDAARSNAERGLTLAPHDPALRYVVAESHRKRGTAEADRDALSLLRALTGEHPAFAPGWRSLGITLFRTQARAEAAISFRRYLELSPDASDRAYILDFIQQCESIPHSS